MYQKINCNSINYLNDVPHYDCMNFYSAFSHIVSSMVTRWPWVTYWIHSTSYSFNDERRQSNEHDKVTH